MYHYTILASPKASEGNRCCHLRVDPGEVALRIAVGKVGYRGSSLRGCRWCSWVLLVIYFDILNSVKEAQGAYFITRGHEFKRGAILPQSPLRER